MQTSIRENILFGETFRPRRYEKVLVSCALKEDLQCLPDGDLTEIGANGINLSGGQKQRISIARALYSSANVVVMVNVEKKKTLAIIIIIINMAYGYGSIDWIFCNPSPNQLPFFIRFFSLIILLISHRFERYIPNMWSDHIQIKLINMQNNIVHTKG